MLKSLFIKNYVLIDNINFDFKQGFSVITGETGAGKSIIIDAFSLLLGKRADNIFTNDKENKCIIEANFCLNNNSLEKLFNDCELEFDTNCILRRELLPNGKSRAFVNDSQVNLSTLKSISERLVDLHSQHENLALSTADYKLNIIDSIAGTIDKFSEYQTNFENLNNLKSEIKSLEIQLEKTKHDVDYYKFQVEQIEAAKLDDTNEMENLENQSNLLENAEEIKNSFSLSLNLLEADENSVETFLVAIKSSLNKISRNYKPAQEILERLESVLIEIRDINQSIADEMEKAESNPELLEKINSRINIINDLLSKHKVYNIKELNEKCFEYNKYILNTENIENKINELKQTIDIQYSKTVKLAEELSIARSKSFNEIEQYICNILFDLGIKNPIFFITNEKFTELTNTGFDNIVFMFSANKSVAAQVLEKVASGGEFSRLMLALKSLIANVSGISTIVFDEIDTGVSGEIANKMGKIMKKLSEKCQVISITHLPQVAALGQTHYKVFKDSSNNKSITNIEELDFEKRISEIASMISGEALTTQAIENAKILLIEN